MGWETRIEAGRLVRRVLALIQLKDNDMVVVEVMRSGWILDSFLREVQDFLVVLHM